MSGQLTNAYVSNIRNEHAQALENIMRLQEMEKKLYQKLEQETSVASNVGNYEETIAQINNLAQSRISLYKTLGNMYEYVQNNVSNSRVDLVDQLTLTRTVEAELADARKHMNELNRIKNDKLRMVDINAYFGKRFQANSGIMKWIILICIPLLLVSVLSKMLIIPEVIARYLSGIILAVGLFVLVRKSWDLYVRSTMNFDEYNFQESDPDSVHPTVWEYNKKHFNYDIGLKKIIGQIGLDCYGDACCSDGMSYDEEKMQCVIGSVQRPGAESFISGCGKEVQPYGGQRKPLYYI